MSAPTPTALPIDVPDEQHEREVRAAIDDVWRLIADPTRTPEWSAVVRRSAWVGGVSSPVVGARFQGHNRFNGFRWVRECEVTEAEAPHLFAFSTFGKDGREQTRWRYTLARAGSDGSHTLVTLAYQVVTLPRWVAFLRRVPGAAATSARQATANMTGSLERIAALVEGA